MKVINMTRCREEVRNVGNADMRAMGLETPQGRTQVAVILDKYSAFEYQRNRLQCQQLTCYQLDLQMQQKLRHCVHPTSHCFLLLANQTIPMHSLLQNTIGPSKILVLGI